ncbi:hypothetical protein [Amycolatopsis sp. NPDC054798]
MTALANSNVSGRRGVHLMRADIWVEGVRRRRGCLRPGRGGGCTPWRHARGRASREGIMHDSTGFAERSSFRRDSESIIGEVLWSSDLRDVFRERRWGTAMINQLQDNLMRDEDFLRRMRSVHASVADRATQLDEHFNEKPRVAITDLSTLRKPQVRTLFLMLGTILAPAIVVPLLLPVWSVFQAAAAIAIGYGVYRFPWVDSTVADALPPAWQTRRMWGRRRFRLRLGVTRLRWDWKTSVRNDVVLPEILARINQGAHRTFSHDLRIHDPFLAWRYPASVLIPTDAVRRLGRELSQTATGAIALAGRRGVGKTTLLRALADGVLPQADLEGRLTVVVPAPARYQLREFVLHLHATVCRAVLEAMGNPRVAHGSAVMDRWEHHQRAADRRAAWLRAAKYFVRATAWLAAGLSLAAIFWRRQHDFAGLPALFVAQYQQLTSLSGEQAEHGLGALAPALLRLITVTACILLSARSLLKLVTLPLRRLPERTARQLGERVQAWGGWWQYSTIRAGLVSVIARISPALPQQLRPKVLPTARRSERARRTLTGIERGRRLHQLSEPMRVLAALATEQLRRIRFLQTHTSGWSGKVDGPRGMGMTVTRSIAHAEQPLTQPEVVDQLRGFLQRAATTLIRAGEITGIAIAIDELDKFADPAQAHEFVNEIKTVFGVTNCVFLVSVSDDALASFELRGIPVRDALDSAFTAMITVDPFTLAEAHDWLDHRLIGLPSPYACLCYVLSAGIPRELERVAATLRDLDRDDPLDGYLVFGHRLSPPLRLAHVTSEIVATDVAAKLRAFTFTVHQQPPGESASDIIVTLNTVGELVRPSQHDLVPRLDLLAGALRKHAEADDGAALIRICREAAGFCHLCAAVLEIFDDGLDEGTLHALTAEALPRLAEARRALAVEPLLTWSVVSDIRRLRAQLRANEN